ncbi:MAG TPA: gluconokinase, GntK/IdnK-type [Opitutaceae bacterium]|nr:gluconokinase, GntK/IdnK-type [Opitutaceae bacterium]
MPRIPGLRSNYAKVDRLVYFGRMLDKIRLQAAAKLPPDYLNNLGAGFDGRCCVFLGVEYAALKSRVLAGGTDRDVLAWCHEQGGARTDDQCNIWNRFMMKVGWRDDRTPVLRQRIADYGLGGKPIETFFDLNEFDEARDPVATRAWELRDPLVVLVMGVAGSGKTTVGQQLADTLGWNFADADEFHAPANIAKMAAGQPLSDDDRAPWLAAIRAHISSMLERGENAVVTCSALKEKYRRDAVAEPAKVKIVHLAGDFNLILDRLNRRTGHFMKPDMLRSQFETLEPPSDAFTPDIARPPGEIVAEIRRAFSL